MNRIQICRPSNGHVLAQFERFHDYRYRLSDETEIPLQVQYAWCVRCERFVEVEKRYLNEEILRRMDRLRGTRAHGILQSALAWNQARKSPGRCLSCGSCFAFTVIPEGQVVAHPGGSGKVMIGGRVNLGGYPPAIPKPVFFDPEGIRIES